MVLKRVRYPLLSYSKFTAMGRTKAAGAAHTGQAFRAQLAAKVRVQAGRQEATRVKEARTAAFAAAREKREEKQRRRAENELKSANYQVVSCGRVAVAALAVDRTVLYELCLLLAHARQITGVRPAKAEAHVKEAVASHQEDTPQPSDGRR